LVAVEEEPVLKVTFEDVSDFKFEVAYEAYSKAFDKAKGAEEKRRLNSKISQLYKNEISYPSFYNEVNQYLGDDSRSQGFSRARIQTKSKREYRREEQKVERIKRHKK
jgi:hypothetical protein